MIKDLTTDSEILHTKCEDVDFNLAKEIAQDLLDTQNSHKTCVGLAANQIGYLATVFVVGESVYIQPTFEPIRTSGIKSGWEGCMSLPNFNTKVRRWKKIKVSYINLNGEEIHETLSGQKARIFQHEFDHLQGKLISD